MKVITIGTDKKVFEEGSAVRERFLKQRELFTELHVIVFTRRSLGFRTEQLGNLWLYPTSSLSRWLYVRDAVSLSRGLIKQRGMKLSDSVISVQDPFECGLAGCRSARRDKIPLHVQIHTDFLSPYFKKLSLLNRIRVFLASYVLPRAAGIRTVSSRIARSLRTSRTPFTAKVSVLPVFSAQAVKWGEKPLRRFKPASRGDSCLALSASRFTSEKNISLALRALEIARGEGSAVGLVIVGEGPEKDRIRDEIVVRDLEAAVKLELWQSNLSSLYRVADAVLVTSDFEGYGLVLLEAGVHGQPIVTTDVGIARELIKPPYERFICPVRDAECIAERLGELSRDPKLRRAYGSALRTNAVKMLIPEKEYWKRYYEDIERCIG